MKITVCDRCHKEGKKLVETIRFMKVKNHPELRLDLCDPCMTKIKSFSMKEYVRLAYKLTMDMDIDSVEAKGQREFIFKHLNLR